RVTTLAVYVTSSSLQRVDFACEVCEQPRFFEWNLMQHDRLPEFCVDLDGVLCCDPTDTENDDGLAYTDFLRDAEPRFIPTRPVGSIVTCRLEKYRDATEAWLAQHGVSYGELVMMDLPDKQAREASGSHAAFKAAAYSRSDSCLFVESSWTQAQAIARISGKPVISLEQQAVAQPNVASQWRRVLQRTRQRPREVLLKPYVQLQRKLQRFV
ncbi:MAG TPA: phosphoribosyltransferase, partial [Dehalococcoidia bacterium]|nr:phosphoribosyltransferase [Dehalococcoidia bacterium]